MNYKKYLEATNLFKCIDPEKINNILLASYLYFNENNEFLKNCKISSTILKPNKYIEDLMYVLDKHFEYPTIRVKAYLALTFADSDILRSIAVKNPDKNYSVELLNIAKGKIKEVIEALIQELKVNKGLDSKNYSAIQKIAQKFI